MLTDSVTGLSIQALACVSKYFGFVSVSVIYDFGLKFVVFSSFLLSLVPYHFKSFANYLLKLRIIISLLIFRI